MTSANTVAGSFGLLVGTELDEIHKRMGLDAVDDLVITPTGITIGGISLTITKVGDTVTISRV